MLKIRLQRIGRKNQPFYRVALVEHTTSTKGKFIEKFGFYNPLIKPWSLEVDTERILEWIGKGAQPSSTMARLLKAEGVKGMEKYIKNMADRKKKKEEEVKEEAPKAEAAPAAEEAAAPADDAAPAEEKPAEEKPAEDKPAEEKSEEDKPAEEEKKEEKSSEEKSAEEEKKEEKTSVEEGEEKDEESDDKKES